jgi:hypothetical protein
MDHLPAAIAESDGEPPVIPVLVVPQPEDAARGSPSGQPAPPAAGSGSVSPKKPEITVEPPPEDPAGEGDEEKPPIPMGFLRRRSRRLSSISIRGNTAGQESASDTNQGEDTEMAGGNWFFKTKHPKQATEDKGGEKR